jgi:hypothetical protein
MLFVTKYVGAAWPFFAAVGIFVFYVMGAWLMDVFGMVTSRNWTGISEGLHWATEACPLVGLLTTFLSLLLALLTYGEAGPGQVVLCLLVLMISLGACTKTQIAPYQHHASADAFITPYRRLIEVQIDHLFFEDRPDCVLLLPMAGSARQSPLGQLMENYLALHLGLRFNRVIHGHDRDRTMVRAGLNRMNLDDRHRFRENAVCGYEFAFQMIHARAEFVLVWARLSLGLEARLIRAEDNRVLWKARHIATRSEGGIAVSPFGAVSSLVEATALMSDGDQLVVC